jgi:hypothetical protein
MSIAAAQECPLRNSCSSLATSEALKAAIPHQLCRDQAFASPIDGSRHAAAPDPGEEEAWL